MSYSIKKHQSEEQTPENHAKGIDCEADQFFKDINIQFLLHELKDPLSIVETGLLLLLEKQQLSGPLTVRQEKMLQRILRSSRKVRSMVLELLEVGRAGAQCFTPILFSPKVVVLEILLDVIESKDVELFDLVHSTEGIPEKLAVLMANHISVVFEDDLQPVEVVQDKTKFSQIAANLLKNAFQHRKMAIKIQMELEKGHLYLSVADDGPGIDPIHHEVVFERYRQIAPEGMQRLGHGLGLAMARILARSMGGDITLDSEPGKGATFILMLPLKTGG